jgi:hypothetical protein
MKLFRLCIHRFFDANCRLSSMSYRQIARDGHLVNETAIRFGQKVLGRWLEIEKGKGFKSPHRGSARQGRERRKSSRSSADRYCCAFPNMKDPAGWCAMLAGMLADLPEAALAWAARSLRDKCKISSCRRRPSS